MNPLHPLHPLHPHPTHPTHPTYFTYPAFSAYRTQQSWQLAGTPTIPQYIGLQFLTQIPPSHLAALPPTGIYPGSMQYPFPIDVPSLPPVPVLAHIVPEIRENPPAQTSSYSGVVDNSGSSSHSLQSNPSSFSSEINQNQEDEAPSRQKSSSKRKRPSQSERAAIIDQLNFNAIDFNQTYESYMKKHRAYLNSCIETGEVVNWFKKYKELPKQVRIVGTRSRKGKEIRYKVDEVVQRVEMPKLVSERLPEASASALAPENLPFPLMCKKSFIPQPLIKETLRMSAVLKLPSSTRQVTICQDFHKENQLLNVEWTENGKVKKLRASTADLYVNDKQLDSFRPKNPLDS